MSARKSQKLKSHKLDVGNQRQLPLFIFILVFFVGFCTHLLISRILAQSQTDSVIHACAKKRTGELRIIVDHKDYREGRREKERKENKEDKNGCRENEISLEWNKEGPAGSSGSGGGGGASFPLVCPECSIGNVGDRLAGKDLSNAVLPFVNFEGSNLTGTNFFNALLQSAEFTGANLSNANFENANLQHAKLEDANVSGVKWKNTTCPDGTNSDANNNTCEGH